MSAPIMNPELPLAAFAEEGPPEKVVWTSLWYYLDTQGFPEPVHLQSTSRG